MNLFKGISEKKDGKMKVYSEGGAQNRGNFLNKLKLSDKDLVLAGLVHGNRIVVVNDQNRGKIIDECDGLVTNAPNIILGVTAADCLPIYFWNKSSKNSYSLTSTRTICKRVLFHSLLARQNKQKTVIGIAHAGWRGVKSEIVKEMVSIFINKYKCKVEDIMVEIGPHILDCHFEVQEDLTKTFFDYKDCFKKVNNHDYLNLNKIVEKQLLSTGLNSENITKATECTYCCNNGDKYFSYRRDKPKEVEAMLAYMVLK